jgi:hypothetical protein
MLAPPFRGTSPTALAQTALAQTALAQTALAQAPLPLSTLIGKH